MTSSKHLINGSGFISHLEPEVLARLEGRLRTIKVRKGQVVLEHGSSTRNVCFLKTGELRVLLYSTSGREVSVRTLKVGDMFGELAALDGLPRAASVIAMTASSILSMSYEDFLTCLEDSKRASLWLAQDFAAQIRRLTDRIFELSALNVRSRLHCELLRLGLLAGLDGNTAMIEPCPTHTELANRIGTHREAVTRELSDLAKCGLVELRRRSLRIADVGRLTSFVQQFGAQSMGVYPTPRSSSWLAHDMSQTSAGS